MNHKEKMERFSTAIGDIDDKYVVADYGVKKAKKISKTLLILVAVIGVLTAGAWYTGLLPEMVNTFAYHLGLTNVQTKIVQEIGRPVGASVTNKGITLTVDAIMCDENTAMVLYTMTKDDGTSFDLPVLSEDEGEYYFKSWIAEDGGSRHAGTDFSMDGVSNGGAVKSEVIDIDPSDNVIQIIETLELSVLPTGRKVTAEYRNLIHTIPIYDEDGTYIEHQETVLYEGIWAVEYHFSYGNSVKTLLENQIFTYNDTAITLNKLSISPFSISLEIEYPKLPLEEPIAPENPTSPSDPDWIAYSEEIMAVLEANRAIVEGIPYSYTKSNGEVVDMSGSIGTSYQSERPNIQGYAQHFFIELTPLEEITSVTIGDFTVEVS